MAELWQGLLDGVADPSAQMQLHRYFELMLEWNTRLNLTAITEPTEATVKHFWDSLSLSQLNIEQTLGDVSEARVIDVGTGAGLPGIPLAVCHPEWQFVLCDALNKRLNFLQHVSDELGLKNIRLVHGRAEDLARASEFRNSFDLVLSRAVARLRVLLELTVPFCRPGGLVVAYKGSVAAEEVVEAKRALEVLHTRVVDVHPVELPLGYGLHHLVSVTPVTNTAKAYPRKAGTPQKQPL
jgi:16S rRNA (guanine527-N7)-methyltransferase